MNNPFKIIGTAIGICLISVLIISLIPSMVAGLDHAEWLLLVSFAATILITTLVQTLQISNNIKHFHNTLK